MLSAVHVCLLKLFLYLCCFYCSRAPTIVVYCNVKIKAFYSCLKKDLNVKLLILIIFCRSIDGLFVASGKITCMITV